MPVDFKQKYGSWACIAGASEGLGAEFAHQLAQKDLNLILIARTETKLQNLAGDLKEKYGIEVLTLVLDLADKDLLSKIEAKTQSLEVGILVYNAAFSALGSFLNQPLENHLKLLSVNCFAPLSLSYFFAQKMKERKKGAIILLSSLAALQGSATIAHYAASKAYNLVLAEGLWAELQSHQIDVIACCAGATNTPAYVKSKPAKASFFVPPLLEPETVVRETLAALGKKPSIIPGIWNRLAAFLMSRILSRKTATQIMSRNTRKMYGN